MALYIGNITNVIVCQAYKISFVEYSAWMILPCLASVAACYIMLRIVFRGERYIPATVKIPDVDPRSHLVDPSGAKFGMAMLACSIGCLIGTSFAHVPVWIVTGPFALLAFARDLWSDWRRNGPVGVNSSVLSRPDQESVTDMQIDPTDSIEIGQCSSVEVVETSKLPYVRDPSREASWDISGSKESLSIELANLRSSPLVSVQNECNVSVHSMPNAVPATDSTSIHHAGIRDVSTVTLPVSNPSVKEPGALRRRFPLTREILVRMPWSILPFTLSMFIIVEGMSSTGWIGLFASWFARLIPNYIVAVYAVGLVAVLLCNIFNNVPMTILVARILLHPNFADSPLATPKVVKGCLFALVIASNLGACTTLISSLAGLMWDSVLRNKRSNVGFWNFLRWNMAVMPVVIISALSVVIVELTVIY
ncbi:hypothetical protein BGW38_003226 [Lunasporangiospora selenospora]|uniref:Citrate transporter-like domain-containing protein n=1 Tax=Lunasporangiospora selenospora TaxID=979761 RepID=A0A9P6KCV4_9FUNG|nr:hypothetical protein BGW38_003226 [Lunasporangiospora selenospora]